MIKTLQKKFIVTAMIAISVLIVVLLGTINIFNFIRVKNECKNILETLVQNEGMNFDEKNEMELPHVNDELAIPEYDGAYQKMDRPVKDNFFNPQVTGDLAMSAVFFLVRVDSDGNVVHTDVNRISSVDEEQAAEYALYVLEASEESGKVDDFKYRIANSRDGQGQVIVFLNMKNSNSSIIAVLFISVGIGVISWLLMLLLVIALSRKAIRPIAVNVEKQKQFVTDAGHEIKTPLAIIMANTEAMELHTGESKWSRIIRTQVTRLNGLMQNLLTLSRMDEGGSAPVMSDTDMSVIVREIVDSFAESAKQKNISLDVDIASDISIRANRENMVQLITILMDNAVKYSATGRPIALTLHSSGKGFVFRIKNFCDELPDIDEEMLFDRFYRGDSARTQKNGGYGIGLSIARAIVEAHKGSIKAEFGRDKAITFSVIL